MRPSRPPIWTKAVQAVNIRDGVILVGSDCHYRPGQPRSTAHAAWVRLAHELKPRVIVANGDVMDFPTISVHPRIGWEDQPTVADELEIGKERLGEFEDLEALLYWTAGNHDLRFEMNLAKHAAQYAEIEGFHLHDHFPEWYPCWMLEVNPHRGTGALRIKHRWKGGTHAAHNNTVGSGCSIVTGHLHSAKVTPYTDYTGTRYGVDTGCIAVPYDAQFIHYTEAGPVNWRSAVTVLTIWDGQLLAPEQLYVLDEGERLTMFRGIVRKESI